MLNLERILGNDRLLRATTGLNRKAFAELLPSFAEAYQQRPVQRPKDSVKQKQHYSGKKKRHTRKHITGSTRKKRVIILTQAREGKFHDKRQLEEEELVGNIPEAIAVEGDLGFQGLQNEFENIHLPHKKSRGRELSEQQKQENRELSRQRVKCEHAHAGSKRYNAVTDVYRNRVPDFDDRLMLNAAGLGNFYLDSIVWSRIEKTLSQS